MTAIAEKARTTVSGKLYNITHIRKGEFQLRVEGEDDEFIYGVIDGGVAEKLEGATYSVGEKISVRKSFCTIIPLEA